MSTVSIHGRASSVMALAPGSFESCEGFAILVEQETGQVFAPDPCTTDAAPEPAPAVDDPITVNALRIADHKIGMATGDLTGDGHRAVEWRIGHRCVPVGADHHRASRQDPVLHVSDAARPQITGDAALILQ